MQKTGTSGERRSVRGVTVIEYAILLALVAIAFVAAAPNIGSAVVGVFGRASSAMLRIPQ